TSITNYVPAFAFERSNYRVDEYDGNDDAVNPFGSSTRLIDVDIIFARPPVQMYQSAAGRVRVRINDAQNNTTFLNPPTMAGSDIAESPPPQPGGDPFSGRAVHA